jgi:hypothetical protein
MYNNFMSQEMHVKSKMYVHNDSRIEDALTSVRFDIYNTKWAV